MGYADQTGLTRWPLTLFVPLSGRTWAWEKLSRFLDNQTYPHDRLRVLLCDTSQNVEFASAPCNHGLGPEAGSELQRQG